MKHATLNRETHATIHSPIRGAHFEKGQGFSAMSYRDAAFQGQMDPLVMVDHYRMTAPTFGAHPHAGLSAVSIIFEDSIGRFRNRDSMGTDIDLHPGDLYWLSAGRGAVHDEYPRSDSSIHGLQVFINTPRALKQEAPQSLHVNAKAIPVIEGDGYRVRVVLGDSNQVQGHAAPILPMTILDGFLSSDGRYTHDAKPLHNNWIIAVQGKLEICVGERTVVLQQDEALALNAFEGDEAHSIQIVNASKEKAHFVLFSGQAVNEDYVQEGPFVMSTQKEIEQVRADYAAGKLGAIAEENEMD